MQAFAYCFQQISTNGKQPMANVVSRSVVAVSAPFCFAAVRLCPVCVSSVSACASRSVVIAKVAVHVSVSLLSLFLTVFRSHFSACASKAKLFSSLRRRSLGSFLFSLCSRTLFLFLFCFSVSVVMVTRAGQMYTVYWIVHLQHSTEIVLLVKGTLSENAKGNPMQDTKTNIMGWEQNNTEQQQ